VTEVNTNTGERGPLRLTRNRRIGLYAVAIGVWLTGGLWLIYHYFLEREGPFGFESHPLEKTWLILHAGFSFAAIWLLGMLWAIHIVRGWNMKWRRRSGGTMVGVMLVLVVSGCSLYYIDSQVIDEWTAILHWAVGLAALAVFFIHWLSKSRPAS